MTPKREAADSHWEIRCVLPNAERYGACSTVGMVSRRSVAITATFLSLALALPGASLAQPAGAALPPAPIFPVLPSGDATPGMPRSPFWQGMNGARDVALGPVPIILSRNPAPPTTFQALTTMPQNWNSATGELMYSYQGVEIPRGAGNRTPQQMFAEMATFQHFSANNIATARMITAPAGTVGPNATRRFVMFRADPATTVVGGLNFAQQFLNSEWVPVEILTDEANMTITAVTMGDHMIVGVRRWTVVPNADGSYRIETEAWEQRNGMVNNVAMVTGVPLVLSGKEVMGMVWDVYLNNLGQRATGARRTGGAGDRYTYTPGTNNEAGLWRHRPRGSENPFRAGIPGSGVPGRMPPPGFFGPSYGPGDAVQARGIFHPDDFRRNVPLLINDTRNHANAAALQGGMQVILLDQDLARIQARAPWYRVPDRSAAAVINRTGNALGAAQTEFINSDLNTRVALPLRRAAEGTVEQIQSDFIETPLNQNYLLPTRRAVEAAPAIFRATPVNQGLLRMRRKLTGNLLDGILGSAAPVNNGTGATGGWNGGLYSPTTSVASTTNIGVINAGNAQGAGMNNALGRM